jgi:hypothetical protein
VLSPEEQPELVGLKRQLLAHVEQLLLPPNFLDALVDALGGPGRVAEMTGRKVGAAAAVRGRACSLGLLDGGGRPGSRQQAAAVVSSWAGGTG